MGLGGRLRSDGAAAGETVGMRGLDPHIDQAVGKARRRTFRDWDVHRLHVRTAADHLPGLAARAPEQDRQGAAHAASLGRATWRESAGPYVYIYVCAGSLKK